MPHGGPWANDELGYDYWAQFLAERGYAVLQPNFRGSTGYGEDFLRAGQGQLGFAMQDDVSDGVRWAVGEGIADAKRVCIVGASYGGYARSEEHTSELQSLMRISYAVFCLKKKTTNNI